MKFKKGDIIESKLQPGLEREIVKARTKSYLWKYPLPLPEQINLFDSRNSSDPELVYWKLKIDLEPKP